MKRLLIILITGLILTACNGGKTKTTVKDIQTEDGTFVSSDYYTNLTDEEIAEIELNGGAENYYSQR